MSGGKGGSTTQAQNIPDWLQGPVVENLARAKQVSQLDYMPYMGPTVAAQTPLQQAAIQNTSSAAGAFGLPGAGMTGTEGMPQAQTFAGGVTGYSDFPIYEQARNMYAQYDPYNFQARNSLFGQAAADAEAAKAADAAAAAAAEEEKRKQQAENDRRLREMGP